MPFFSCSAPSEFDGTGVPIRKALIPASASIFLLMSAALRLPLSKQAANSDKRLKLWKPGGIWAIILTDN
jgi:hypothetical protein